MKKLVAFAMLLCLLTPAVAKDKKLNLTGWVTDLKCAHDSVTKSIARDHADCARKCSSDNGAMALVTDSDHRVYAVDNAFMVRGLEGELISVSATPGAAPDSLKITSVMLKQSHDGGGK
jgi:hypothetical protein